MAFGTIKFVATVFLASLVIGCSKDDSSSENQTSVNSGFSSNENNQERLKVACRRDEEMYKKNFLNTVSTNRKKALDSVRVCEKNFTDQNFKNLIASSSIEHYEEIISSPSSSDEDKIVAIELGGKYDPSFMEKNKKLKNSLEKEKVKKAEESAVAQAKAMLDSIKFQKSSPSFTSDDVRKCFDVAGVPYVPDYAINPTQLDIIAICVEKRANGG